MGVGVGWLLVGWLDADRNWCCDEGLLLAEGFCCCGTETCAVKCSVLKNPLQMVVE